MSWACYDMISRDLFSLGFTQEMEFMAFFIYIFHIFHVFLQKLVSDIPGKYSLKCC